MSSAFALSVARQSSPVLRKYLQTWSYFSLCFRWFVNYKLTWLGIRLLLGILEQKWCTNCNQKVYWMVILVELQIFRLLLSESNGLLLCNDNSLILCDLLLPVKIRLPLSLFAKKNLLYYLIRDILSEYYSLSSNFDVLQKHTKLYVPIIKNDKYLHMTNNEKKSITWF